MVEYEADVDVVILKDYYVNLLTLCTFYLIIKRSHHIHSGSAEKVQDKISYKQNHEYKAKQN
jgi:hypothetical protein